MLEKYFNLEERFEVRKIRINNLYLWPYLRIYFGYKLVYENVIIGAKLGSQNLALVLSTLFIGFKNLFGKYDYIFFSVGEQRRNINNLYYDRFDFVVNHLNKPSLFFELLFPIHHKKKSVPTKHRVSRSILFIVEYVLIKLLVFRSISGKSILERINSDYNLDIRYKPLSRKVYAQYLIGKAISRIYKPKAVFLITSYTNIGYVIGFKKAGIKVIEMQHGVINSQHLGYNPSIDFGNCYKPDYLLTFGVGEIDVFKGVNFYISPESVLPVGHFYFDYLINEYKGDERLSTLTMGFERLVAVSAEYDFENEIIPFINRVAKRVPQYIFLYMPRNKKAIDYKHFEFEPNVVITDWLNSYQVMRQADFHTCVRSTTALEAVALGTQNILVDIRGYSTAYFMASLTDSRITRFVANEEEYISELKSLQRLERQAVMSSDNNLITPNFNRNLEAVLLKILP